MERSLQRRCLPMKAKKSIKKGGNQFFFPFLFSICGKIISLECKRKGTNIHAGCKKAAIFSTAG
ncbi:hypothetical protein HMPREF9124_2401 [Oribacterium sp. oral taxon 108 str. F0425]|nr:hypothetical protein HMPREF9124_2401 [Oribacterium sp. oral taxon 108 str. F0425]